MSVFTLINKTKRNLVIGNVKGKRITLHPGVPVVVEGDFASHPWINHGWITATEITTGIKEKTAQENTEVQPEVEQEAPPVPETPVQEERQENPSRDERREDRERARKYNR